MAADCTLEVHNRGIQATHSHGQVLDGVWYWVAVIRRAGKYQAGVIINSSSRSSLHAIDQLPKVCGVLCMYENSIIFLLA